MEEIQVETLEIDGKDYVLLESLEANGKKYFYFSNFENQNDIQILKEKIESDEKYFVSLDSETEYDEALILFNQKYKDINKN